MEKPNQRCNHRRKNYQGKEKCGQQQSESAPRLNEIVGKNDRPGEENKSVEFKRQVEMAPLPVQIDPESDKQLLCD